MKRDLVAVLLLLTFSASTVAQTIYFKKDHIYAGGKEIAIVTPAPADQTAPNAPTGLASSNVTSTSVQLSWSAATDSGGSGLAGYKVYRQQGSGASLPVGTVGPGTLSFVDQPLMPATGYIMRVVAFDNAQNHSAFSSSINVTTSSVTDTSAPATPSGLTGYLLTRNSVRLTWNRSIDTGGAGMNGYKLYRNGTLISGASPIATPTFDDTSLAYKTAYAYTVTAIDNASNTSTATSAVNVTTDREVLLQESFNRLDGALGSPWTVSLGSALVKAWTIPSLCPGYDPIYEEPPSLTVDSHLTLATLRTKAASPDLALAACHIVDDGNGSPICEVLPWAPLVWSQAALTPATFSVKGTIDVVNNTSAAGLLLYTQAATGQYTDAGGTTTSYTSTKGYRALLTNSSVVLHYCTDLNYPGPMANVCSTIASAASTPVTGTLSVETNASSGNVKVYHNGTLKLDTTISTSAMTGAVGLATLGTYPSTCAAYTTATVDNFLLERN